MIKMKRTGQMQYKTWLVVVVTLLIVSTAFGNIAVCGTSGNPPDTEWEYTWGDDGLADHGYDVKQTSDGGYIACGAYSPACLVKVDSNGNEEWTKTLSGSSDLQAVEQTSDGGYISTGTKGSDLWLIKVSGDAHPTADYDWTDADGNGPGTTINFDASDSSDDHGIVSYEWDWTSDGSYDATDVTASHDYGDTNDHDCTLRVTDTVGQTDTEVKTVHATVPTEDDPVARYSWSDADGDGSGTTINFDASDSSDDHGIVSYEWDWTSDGSYDATGVTESHDYGDTNDHDCTLRVTDTVGQTDTEVKTVHATVPNEPPNAPTINGPTNGKSKATQEYQFTATDPNRDDVCFQINWEWEEADGDNYDVQTESNGSGVTVTETHTFLLEGSYVIRARAVDDKGAMSDWTTLPVTMPKNKQVIKINMQRSNKQMVSNLNLFVQLLYKIMDRFPMLEQIFSSHFPLTFSNP